MQFIYAEEEWSSWRKSRENAACRSRRFRGSFASKRGALTVNLCWNIHSEAFFFATFLMPTYLCISNQFACQKTDKNIHKSKGYKGVSEVQFCTTKPPQLFELEVATCRTCRLRSKKTNLEVAMPNLQKWWGCTQSWDPCMPIWQPLLQYSWFGLPFIIELGFIFVYFPNKFFKISSQCTGITKKGFRRKSDFQDLRHCFSMR